MARDTWVQSHNESYQRIKKIVLDATLLNTQHYKVRIKGEVEQSREKSSTHLQIGVVAIKKRAFRSPMTITTTTLKGNIYWTLFSYKLSVK